MRAAAAGSSATQPNVADTCIAALALIRSGSTPREGPYKDAIAKAVRLRPLAGRGVRRRIARRHERARGRASR